MSHQGQVLFSAEAAVAVMASSSIPFAPGARCLAPRRDDAGMICWSAASVVSAEGEIRRVAFDCLADPDAPADAWDAAARVGELHPMGPEPIDAGANASVCGLLIEAGRALGLSGGQLVELAAGGLRDRGACALRARVVRALKDGRTGAGAVSWAKIGAALGRDRESVRSLYARKSRAGAA